MIHHFHNELYGLALSRFGSSSLRSSLSWGWSLLLVLLVVLVIALTFSFGWWLLLFLRWVLCRSLNKCKLFEVDLQELLSAPLHLPIECVVSQLLKTCIVPLWDDLADLPSADYGGDSHNARPVILANLVLLDGQINEELWVLLHTFKSLLINFNYVPLLVLDLVIGEDDALSDQVLQEVHWSQLEEVPAKFTQQLHLGLDHFVISNDSSLSADFLQFSDQRDVVINLVKLRCKEETCTRKQVLFDVFKDISVL